MPDIKAKYGTAQAMTVTNLHSLATSSTRIAGWSGDAIDNSSTLALDFHLSASITVAAAGLAVGQIDLRVYGFVSAMSAGTPDIFSSGTEGTQGTATIHDEEQREAGLHLHAAAGTDTNASRVYHLAPRGIARLFGGFPPPFWAPFIAHNTGANLNASANRVDYIPILAQFT